MNHFKYIFLIFTVLLAACASDKTENTSTEPPQNALEVNAFEMAGGWGYDVVLGGKKIIHQDRIPAVQGVQLFANKEDAMKVGRLVAEKIMLNALPPTVSISELDSLNISYKKRDEL